MPNFLLLATGCLRPRPAIDLPAVISFCAPLSYLPTRQTSFPSRCRLFTFEPVVAFLPLHSSPISIRYPECLGLFVFATHSLRGHVGKLPSTVSWFDEHNEEARLPASSVTTCSTRQTYCMQPAPHALGTSRTARPTIHMGPVHVASES